MARDAEATIRGPAQPRWLAFVHDERSNIDSALAWCARHDPLLGVRIANGFGWTWVVLGDGIAGAYRVRSALHLTRLGRVRHQAGQLQAASETLTLAIQAAIRCRLASMRLLNKVKTAKLSVRPRTTR